jgi:hypothetical protein
MSAGRFVCPRRIDPLPEGSSDYWKDGGEYWAAKDAWPDGFTKPRICSHCGGLNADDAIALVGEGWILQATDKRYKFYLEPEGAPHPLPPAKVYLMHMSENDVRRADEIMRVRRLFIAATLTDDQRIN